MKQPTITIAVTDDHTLFRKGLIRLLESISLDYQIIIEANNGIDFINKITATNLKPQIAIMDINMPGKDGYETVAWLNKYYPTTHVLVISMVEKEESIVKMLKMGVKGYLSKDVEPEDLKAAIYSILNKGFYYTDFITGRLLHSLQKEQTNKIEAVAISEKELEMLHWFCTELSYKEISNHLNISVKTIDAHRDTLCKKLNVVSRIGLAIYAIKNGIVQL